MALVVMSALLAACSAAGEEPVGLGPSDGVATSTSTPGEAEPTATADATTPAQPDDEGGDEPEPQASFTQPYVPGEPRVIDLPDELPVRPPDGINDEQQAVLDAVGRFMASWQAVLFGADEDRSGIAETSGGAQLDQLRGFIADAAEQEWVFTGEPMLLRARSVEVDGDAATVDLCIGLPNWFEFRGGQLQLYNSLERYTIDLERADDAWLATDTQQTDESACDAG